MKVKVIMLAIAFCSARLVFSMGPDVNNLIDQNNFQFKFNKIENKTGGDVSISTRGSTVLQLTEGQSKIWSRPVGQFETSEYLGSIVGDSSVYKITTEAYVIQVTLLIYFKEVDQDELVFLGIDLIILPEGRSFKYQKVVSWKGQLAEGESYERFNINISLAEDFENVSATIVPVFEGYGRLD